MLNPFPIRYVDKASWWESTWNKIQLSVQITEDFFRVHECIYWPFLLTGTLCPGSPFFYSWKHHKSYPQDYSQFSSTLNKTTGWFSKRRNMKILTNILNNQDLYLVMHNSNCTCKRQLVCLVLFRHNNERQHSQKLMFSWYLPLSDSQHQEYQNPYSGQELPQSPPLSATCNEYFRLQTHKSCE